MIDVVFISDLHLHRDDLQIKARFDAFINWAQASVKSVYILGDLFHAWPGDDAIDEWSAGIANQLKNLANRGISIFYMHGNRDFLLGKRFAALAGWTTLTEPCIVPLENKVLLVHGDRYCTKDISHQRFRLLTRNKLFTSLFLCLPLSFRNSLVNKVRIISSSNQKKTWEEMDVVDEAVKDHMQHHQVVTLIHGHTHKPDIHKYTIGTLNLTRYVLSDWDDTPQLLCYDNTKGFYFIQLQVEELRDGTR